MSHTHMTMNSPLHLKTTTHDCKKRHEPKRGSHGHICPKLWRCAHFGRRCLRVITCGLWTLPHGATADSFLTSPTCTWPRKATPPKRVSRPAGAPCSRSPDLPGNILHGRCAFFSSQMSLHVLSHLAGGRPAAHRPKGGLQCLQDFGAVKEDLSVHLLP